MIDRTLLGKLDFGKPYAWLSTWFGCGLMQPAPGTWGTLGGMPLGIILGVIGGWPLLLVGAAVVAAVGYRAAKKFEEATGEHDCGAVVIDEVAGVLLALAAAGNSPLLIIMAFVLFRIFDILKPWPVNWCDQKLPGAWGVMADDLVAGLYAALCLGGLRYAGIG